MSANIYDPITKTLIPVAGNADAGPAELNSLNDVYVASPSDGQVLKYNATLQIWTNGSGSVVTVESLADIGDVDLVGLTDGQTIVWDAENNRWVNGDSGITYTAGNGIDITSNEIGVKLNSANTNGLQTTASGLSLNVATNVASGAMSATDKAKLDTLENYDDTAIQAAVADKVDKVTGKGLSTNDFTDVLKQKLEDSVAYD